MAKTTNLGLEITTSDSELFEDWRNFINGNNEYSMAKILDAFAGSIVNQMGGLFGVTGDFTIEVSDWDGSIAEIIFSTLGENDAIIFSPFSVEDKSRAEEANIFVSTDEENGSKVYFTAEILPEENIKFNYFIMRGKANE